MRLVETLEGTGTVVSKSGESTTVRYKIWVHQDEIRAGPLQNPTATIPGMKSITGNVQPFCGTMGEMLTLKLRDGRSAVFFFQSSDGSVWVNSLQ